MPKPTVSQLSAHVASICKSFCIEVRSHSGGGRACRRDRWIAIRPVRSAVTYAVALHEIGHVVGPRQSKGGRLDKEVSAWEWALENALPGAVGKRFRHTMVEALRSYVRWALARQYRTFPPKIPRRALQLARLGTCCVQGERADRIIIDDEV